jgi:tetratricopeptide (TPR) repeat protein
MRTRCSLGSLLFALALSFGMAVAGEPPPKPAVDDAGLLQGLSELHQGRFLQAQVRFRTFLQQHPTDPRGHLFLAFCEWWRLLQSGRDANNETMAYHVEEALRLAQAQVDKAPDDPEALSSLGTAYIFLAQYRATQKHVFKAASAARKGKGVLEKAIQLRPDLADAQFGLGAYNYYADKVNVLVKGLRTILFLPGGDSERGLAQLEEVSRRGRYFRSEAHLLLAVILQGRHEHKYRASLGHLQSALELNPGSPIILGSIGELQLRLGYYPESHATLQQAIAASRASRDFEQASWARLLQVQLADSLELSLHGAEALRELGAALQRAPLEADWRSRALAVGARAAYRTGDREALERICDALQASAQERESLRQRFGNPAWQDPALVRSLARVESAPAKDALSLIDQLLEKNPTSPELLFHRGRLAFQQRRWEDSRVYLAKISDSPQVSAPWILGWKNLFLGRSRWEIGQRDSAKQFYKSSLEVDGFRGKDLARALLGPEGADPAIWPAQIFASGLHAPEDARHVAAGLAVGRDPFVAVDGLLAGVVGGQGEGGVVVTGQQLLQVTGPPFEILPGIEDVADLETLGRLRHELHETHRSLP